MPFEILTLHDTTWQIDATVTKKAEAEEVANQMLSEPGVTGVRIVLDNVLIAKSIDQLEDEDIIFEKLEKNKYLGVLFLGIIIRGETSHYDLISSETFRSISTLADKYFNIAIINNVICVEDQSQLEERLVTNTQNNVNALIQLINEKSS